MNATLTPTLQSPAARRHEIVSKLGFARTPDGYCLDGLLLTFGERWSSLKSLRASAPDCESPLGQPGLWKSVQDGTQEQLVFDLPSEILSLEDDESFDLTDLEPKSQLENSLTWALSTAEGRLPAGWESPPRETVESWLLPGRLTLRSGAFVRQGELIHAPDRLALRFPILPSLPDDLPEPRWRWLQQMLRETQDRWRWVRLGVTSEAEGRAVIAEVDLSGAPHPVMEPLILMSVDSLRLVVGWLVESADFLADASLASEALEICPVGETTNHEEQIP